MFLRKLLNLLIFLQVGLGLILHIVVECENHLAGVLDPGGAHGHELLRNGPGVVVGHTPMGLDLYVVAAPDELSLRETDGMALYNLLGQSLWGLLFGWDICEGKFGPVGLCKRRSAGGYRPRKAAV